MLLYKVVRLVLYSQTTCKRDEKARAMSVMLELLCFTTSLSPPSPPLFSLSPLLCSLVVLPRLLSRIDDVARRHQAISLCAAAPRPYLAHHACHVAQELLPRQSLFLHAYPKE